MININIKATGIELTEAIRDYVHKKIGSIEKYLSKEGENVVVQVEVGRSTEHHKTGEVFRAEVHIVGDGLDLYAMEESVDLYAAIDLVKDEISHELVKKKGRRFALLRRGEQMAKDMMKGLYAGVDRIRGSNKNKE